MEKTKVSYSFTLNDRYVPAVWRGATCKDKGAGAIGVEFATPSGPVYLKLKMRSVRKLSNALAEFEK